MEKKRLNILGIFLTAFVINLTAQPTQSLGEMQKDTLITLLQNKDSAKTVILLQKDGYVVKSSLNNLKENLDSWLSQHPNLSSDKELLQLILADSENHKEVDAEKIATRHKIAPRLQYRLADMLEKGKCYIINRANGELVISIKVQTYNFHCGPMCGNGGRRFFINGILLLRVLDWQA